MRAIAVEMGASTGLVTHYYYSNKQELVRMRTKASTACGPPCSMCCRSRPRPRRQRAYLTSSSSGYAATSRASSTRDRMPSRVKMLRM